MNHERGPGNGTGTDSAISTTDTKANSLIRTQKVRIKESVRMVNHERGVPVTVLVLIPGPQCIILFFRKKTIVYGI